MIGRVTTYNAALSTLNHQFLEPANAFSLFPLSRYSIRGHREMKTAVIVLINSSDILMLVGKRP
jgi:hypothetical protein